MLGKRQRPPMKRTTSLSEISFDLNAPVEAPPSDPHRQTTGGGYGCSDQRLSLPPASSPRVRRHSIDFSDNGGQFLRSCGLCKRRLVPSRDIFMYRGDSAFCSQECRQQQMSKDERKEKKCALSSKKLEAAATSAAAGTKVAAKGETISAV